MDVLKKTLLSLRIPVVIACVALAVVGCGGKKAASGEDPGELNIFVWTEYIPESVIDDFASETGIKVNQTVYSSNEDMLNKLKADSPGTYDIVQPSDYMVKAMIEQDLLEPLDRAQLPNFENIAEAYRNQEFDPDNKYSMPYMGGLVTIGYNKDMTAPLTGYNDLWRADLKGQLVLLDDFRQVVGMVGQDLGYGLSATDPTQLDAMRAKLMELKPNVKVFDSDNPKSLLISGEVAAGYSWSAELVLAQRENPSIVGVANPTEGAGLFLDNLCIPKGAKNVEAAHKFIDYILDAEVSASISEEYPYVNPNAAAVDLLSDDYKNNPLCNPPAEVFANGQYIQSIGDSINAYSDIWTEFKK